MTGGAPERGDGVDARSAAGPAAVLPRGLAVVLGTAALVIVVNGMRELSWLLGPAFLALMLVVVVSPVQGWLIRRHIPRPVSTVVVLLLLYSVLVVLVGALIYSLTRLAALLPDYADQADALIGSATQELAARGVGAEQISELLQQIDVNRVADLVTTVLASLTGIASTLVLVLALMFFIGLDAADFPARLARLRPQRPAVAEALLSFAHGTRRYLVVSSVFGAIVAVLDAVALQLLAVPLPLLWAVLAFLTNYIPNIGFFIGLVPPALLGLVSGGPRTLVLVVLAYLLINVVIQTMIQPKFVGDSVGLSTTVTFVAVLFWASVLGPLGALLAIPMTLLTKALLVDVDPASGWIDILIGSTTSRRGSPERTPAAAGDGLAQDAGASSPEPGPATADPADEQVDERGADDGKLDDVSPAPGRGRR